MAISKDQIIAALGKIGPTDPDTLAKHLGCTRNALQYHLKAMLKDGSVKAAGTRLHRVIGLPDQKLEGESAPPQQRQRPGRQAQEEGEGWTAGPAARRRIRIRAGLHGRRAPGDRPRRPAADDLHRTADRADRHAARQLLRGVT